MEPQLTSGPYQHTEGELEGKWDWRLVTNGNVVATSANQGYENKETCVEMFAKVVRGDYSGELNEYLNEAFAQVTQADEPEATAED